MLGDEVRVALGMALERARQERHEFITLEHLLLGLLHDPEASEILAACGANLKKLEAEVAALEHKMGIHGSATCVMVFGADTPARGYLLGNEGDGMRIMFLMMNEARMEVGLQGLCGAAAAYQNALHYAKDRLQGPSIEKFGDATAPRAPIVVHPDVRRMLLWQKVHVETMRGLVYRTALRIDLWHASPDEQVLDQLPGLDHP